MAMRRNGRIKPGEVADEFKISNHTAGVWLKRFEKEGSFSVVPNQVRSTVYLLTDFVP
jgi:transposase